MSSIAANANPERTNKWLLIGAVAAAVITGVLVFAAVLNLSSGDDDAAAGDGDVAVLVAKETIDAGTTLRADLFRVATFGEENVVPQAISDPEAVVGQVAATRVLKGQQLSRENLVQGTTEERFDTTSTKLPDGHRGMAVKVDEVTAVAGLLVPGDYVDVVVTFETKESSAQNARRFKVTRTLLQNVLVMAVEQNEVARVVTIDEDGNVITGTDDPGAIRPDDVDPEESLSTVTMALTPQDIQALTLYDSLGDVTLSLRKFGDASVAPLEDIVVELFD